MRAILANILLVLGWTLCVTGLLWWRRRLASRCPRCDYPLSASGAVCPECGPAKVRIRSRVRVRVLLAGVGFLYVSTQVRDYGYPGRTGAAALVPTTPLVVLQAIVGGDNGGMSELLAARLYPGSRGYRWQLALFFRSFPWRPPRLALGGPGGRFLDYPTGYIDISYDRSEPRYIDVWVHVRPLVRSSAPWSRPNEKWSWGRIVSAAGWSNRVLVLPSSGVLFLPGYYEVAIYRSLGPTGGAEVGRCVVLVDRSTVRSVGRVVASTADEGPRAFESLPFR